eukprot:7880551-Pyramimonas_sp.AAC.1
MLTGKISNTCRDRSLLENIGGSGESWMNRKLNSHWRILCSPYLYAGRSQETSRSRVLKWGFRLKSTSVGAIVACELPDEMELLSSICLLYTSDAADDTPC